MMYAAAAGLGLLLLALMAVLQAGLVMIAASMASDKELRFTQALTISVAANVTITVMEVLLELATPGGSLVMGLPMTLLVWAGLLSAIADMKLSQAFFSALTMAILKLVFFAMVFATLATTFSTLFSSG